MSDGDEYTVGKHICARDFLKKDQVDRLGGQLSYGLRLCYDTMYTPIHLSSQAQNLISMEAANNHLEVVVSCSSSVVISSHSCGVVWVW